MAPKADAPLGMCAAYSVESGSNLSVLRMGGTVERNVKGGVGANADGDEVVAAAVVAVGNIVIIGLILDIVL